MRQRPADSRWLRMRSALLGFWLVLMFTAPVASLEQGESSATVVREAEALLSSGQYQGAITVLREARAKAPGDLPVARLLSKAGHHRR